MYLALDPMFERALIGAIALALSLPFGQLLARMLGVHMASRALHRKTAKIFARLNRSGRQPYTLAMRGAFVMLVMVAGAWLAGALLTHLIYPANRHASLLGVSLLVALFNAGGTLWSLLRMARHARAHEWPAIDGALNQLAPASHGSDGHGKLRLGIRLAATHIQHRLIGSLLAFVVADFAGLLAYRALHLCATHAPSSLPNWRAFGLIIGWVFAPFQALSYACFVCAGSIAGAATPGCAPVAALRAVTSLPGYLAAMLGISLGGTESRYGKAYREPWVGDGTAKLDALHARRAAYWASVCVLVAGLCIAALSRLHSSLGI